MERRENYDSNEDSEGTKESTESTSILQSKINEGFNKFIIKLREANKEEILKQIKSTDLTELISRNLGLLVDPKFRKTIWKYYGLKGSLGDEVSTSDCDKKWCLPYDPYSFGVFAPDACLISLNKEFLTHISELLINQKKLCQQILPADKYFTHGQGGKKQSLYEFATSVVGDLEESKFDFKHLLIFLWNEALYGYFHKDLDDAAMKKGYSSKEHQAQAKEIKKIFETKKSKTGFLNNLVAIKSSKSAQKPENLTFEQISMEKALKKLLDIEIASGSEHKYTIKKKNVNFKSDKKYLSKLYDYFNAALKINVSNFEHLAGSEVDGIPDPLTSIVLKYCPQKVQLGSNKYWAAFDCKAIYALGLLNLHHKIRVVGEKKAKLVPKKWLKKISKEESLIIEVCDGKELQKLKEDTQITITVDTIEGTEEETKVTGTKELTINEFMDDYKVCRINNIYQLAAFNAVKQFHDLNNDEFKTTEEYLVFGQNYPICEIAYTKNMEKILFTIEQYAERHIGGTKRELEHPTGVIKCLRLTLADPKDKVSIPIVLPMYIFIPLRESLKKNPKEYSPFEHFYVNDFETMNDKLHIKKGIFKGVDEEFVRKILKYTLMSSPGSQAYVSLGISITKMVTSIETLNFAKLTTIISTLKK